MDCRPRAATKPSGRANMPYRCRRPPTRCARHTDVSGPPESEDEQRRLTNTLHALEHASRLAEAAGDKVEFTALNGAPDDVRASRLCADAMRSAVVAAREVAAPNVGDDHVTPIEARPVVRELPGAEMFDSPTASTEEALLRLEHCAKTI